MRSHAKKLIKHVLGNKPMWSYSRYDEEIIVDRVASYLACNFTSLDFGKEEDLKTTKIKHLLSDFMIDNFWIKDRDETRPVNIPLMLAQKYVSALRYLIEEIIEGEQ